MIPRFRQWQDENRALLAEVVRRGRRREWWEGFLGSYYEIALPLGRRPTPLSV